MGAPGDEECGVARGVDNAETPKHVEPFPHEEFMDEEGMGCGNPVCVIIDAKPRRFRSLCQMAKFLRMNNRAEKYINFVQKGDCYDIIDNGDRQSGKGGADDKSWINAAPQGCERCMQDKDCNQHVVLIIDIMSVLKGVSSAPGGPIFNPNLEGAKKKSGLPFEYFNPAGGDTCLWTEYFDMDTPCYQDEENENHSKHYEALKFSYTGKYRICFRDATASSQHVGGSEITSVDSSEAQKEVFGWDKTQNGSFKQVVSTEKFFIKCRNTNNKDTSLPAPFIFGQDLNVTCLDYKSRYCCKSQEMWKPTDITTIESQIPPSVPIGLAITTITTKTVTSGGNFANTIIVTVHVYDGVNSGVNKDNYKIIRITPDDQGGNTFTGTIHSTRTGLGKPCGGTFTIKYIIHFMNGKGILNIKPMATMEITTHKSKTVTRVVNTIIKEENMMVHCTTSIDVAKSMEKYTVKKMDKYSSLEEQMLMETTEISYSNECTDKDGSKKHIDLDIVVDVSCSLFVLNNFEVSE